MNCFNIITEEIIDFFVNETYNSINELKKLSNDIVLKIAKNNIDNFKNIKKPFKIEGILLSEINPSNYVELYNFITKFELFIQIKPTDKSKKDKGAYFRIVPSNKNALKKIEIYVNENDIQEIFNELNNTTKEINHKDLYFHLFHLIYKTLLHELQHAFDDFRSDTKIFQTKKTIKYHDDIDKIKDNVKNIITKDSILFSRYLNLQHEVWARFIQAINDIEFVDLIIDDELRDILVKLKPLEIVVKKFISNYYGFRPLNNKIKKK